MSVGTFATPVPSVSYRGSWPTHPTSNHGVQTKDWRVPGAWAAVDIMAPVGTPVVAAEDGTVYHLGSAQGGVSLSLKGISGADHWYGHLSHYTNAIRSVSSLRPVRVRRGQVLGYIGPHPNGSHLHYGVNGANAAAIAATPQPRSIQVGAAGGVKTAGQPKEIVDLGGGNYWWVDAAGNPVTQVDIQEGAVTNVAGGVLRVGGRVLGKLIPRSKKGKVAAGGGAIIGAEYIPGVDIPGIPDNPLGWLFGNWDRALLTIGGFVLMIVGLLIMGRAMGLGPSSKTIAGDVANRLQFGPEVTQARRERMRRTQLTEDMGRPPTKPKPTPDYGDVPF